MRNTPTTGPNGPFIFQILYGSSNYISQTCTNIYQSGAPTPATLTTFFFVLTTTVISANNTNIRFRFTCVNPLPSNAYLHLNFPNSLQIYYSTTNASNPLISSNSTDMYITILNSTTTAAINSTLNLGNFTLTNPPSIRKALITFTTEVTQNSVNYLIDRGSVTVTCIAGVISTANIISTSLLINTNGKYTITFRTVNNLIAGSFINIIFPS